MPSAIIITVYYHKTQVLYFGHTRTWQTPSANDRYVAESAKEIIADFKLINIFLKYLIFTHLRLNLLTYVKREMGTYLKCILFSFTRNKSRQRNKMKGKGSRKAVYKEMQPLASWKKYVQFKIISIQNMPHTIKMLIIFIHIP